MAYKHELTAINCKGESAYIFEFIDFETETIIQAKISGGESNIYGILQHWNDPNGWDRTILFNTREMAKRDFNAAWKNSEYAGCTSEELAKFIKNKLARVNKKN
jgi:inner membrane protein involved in colicin E2 resistance